MENEKGSVTVNSAQREAFEVFARPRSYYLLEMSEKNKRGPDCLYYNARTQYTWEGWVGHARSLASAEATPLHSVTEQADDTQKRQIIVDVLSNHRMVRMYEVEDDGTLGNSYPLIDRLCLDDGRDIQSGVDEVEVIAWAIVRALAQPLASTEAAQPEQASIPTWEDRVLRLLPMPDSGQMVIEEVSAMQAEIRDLRAALATPASTKRDVCAEMRALCSACGGTGDVHSIDGEWRGTCDCPASTAASASGSARLSEEHPNLKVPIDPACSAKLDELGDDRGQGLDPYWKFGFRTGWHYAVLTQRASTAARPEALSYADAAQWARDNGLNVPPEWDRLASTAASEQQAGADWIADVVLSIAEMSDRDSPEDRPEMMLVTAEELRTLIKLHVPAATLPSVREDERAGFEKAVRSITFADDGSFKRDEDQPDDYADYVMGTYWSIWKAALTHRATHAEAEHGLTVDDWTRLGTAIADPDDTDCTGEGATHAEQFSGRAVSVDVSTGDEDSGHRIFAELTGETGSDGTTLLAVETSRNFERATHAATTASTSDIPTVTTVYVKAHHIRCPHCDEEVDGWLGDPRGKTESCDWCKEEFKVHPDADMEMR